LVADTMIANKGDQFGLAYLSFNRLTHYPH